MSYPLWFPAYNHGSSHSWRHQVTSQACRTCLCRVAASGSPGRTFHTVAWLSEKWPGGEVGKFGRKHGDFPDWEDFPSFEIKIIMDMRIEAIQKRLFFLSVFLLRAPSWFWQTELYMGISAATTLGIRPMGIEGAWHLDHSSSTTFGSLLTKPLAYFYQLPEF